MRRFVLAGVMVAAIAVAVSAMAAGTRNAARAGQAGLKLNAMQQRLLSGFASNALQTAGRKGGTAAPNAAAANPYTPTSDTGCPRTFGSNIQVNQNCQNPTDPDLHGRSQAQNETSLAQDPREPSHVVSSSNDYRRGDGACYTYYSASTGQKWLDSTPPIGFTRGDAFGGAQRQYWEASGDTSVDWDTKGNSYLSCQTFNRGAPPTTNADLSSAFYVLRSTHTNGASWNFPARPVAELNDVEGTGAALLDKQLMTVDDHVGSPFQDRIYVSWTLFAADGTAYIYEAHSSNYGESFSRPVVVSRNSPLCDNTYGLPTPEGSCNSNQYSQPFTGPDGTLYVVWSNFNTLPGRPAGDEGDDQGGDAPSRNEPAPAAAPNWNQMLLARSTDGGDTFSAPVLVSRYYELPDCFTYTGQDFGRACVPNKGDQPTSFFRATNYSVGSVDPAHPNRIAVTFGSYINRHSNEDNGCVPQGFSPDTGQNFYEGVLKPGACNNDILVSRSTDGGRTFTGTTTDPRELPSVRQSDPSADQWWQWATFDNTGKFAVSYYDRAYGSDERTGFSDFSLSGSTNLTSFATTRATTSSMPPPTQFSGLFYGDYTGMDARNGVAHPVWSDTRTPALFPCLNDEGHVITPPKNCTGPAPAGNAARANDENVFTRSLAIPVP